MKILRIVAIILLLINGLSALYGGFHLINDPTGMSLGIPVYYLQHSPFSNYLVPGIILFILNGLLSLFTAAWVALYKTNYANLILMQGCILTIWIIVQILMLQEFNSLHFILGTIGIVLIISGLLLKLGSLFNEEKKSN